MILSTCSYSSLSLRETSSSSFVVDDDDDKAKGSLGNSSAKNGRQRKVVGKCEKSEKCDGNGNRPEIALHVIIQFLHFY